MVNIVGRPLIEGLAHRMSAPVTIIEGARAVGKTTALKRLDTPRFGFVTLEDPGQLADAKQDGYGWLMRQHRPLIIDEAQLVPDLLNQVKRAVDILGPGPHFILTGSASLSGDSLGGRNPLAGRSDTYTMWPLTAWELNGQRGSLVDALFDGEPVVGSIPHVEDATLVDEFKRGGLPLNRFTATPLSGPRLDARVESDLRSRLADQIDPELEFNIVAARAAADHLLCAPGAVFNAQRLTNQLGFDARTVKRYLEIFHRLFLMWSLRNLASSPTRQGYQRIKVYPVDTAFAVDAMRRAGIDPLAQREAFGALLESYVTQQVKAAAEWSVTRPDAFYWRDKQQREVDLVLKDSRGRVVGIEVKSTSSVGSDDARGLRALATEQPLHRGFIVYRGTEVRRLDDTTWALPVEALGNSSTFAGDWNPARQPESGIAVWSTLVADPGRNSMAPEQEPTDATVFLSYVHDDDRHSGGRMVQFAKDVVDAYAFLTGGMVELFVDRDNIRWGQQWKRRLDEQLDRTTFLMPMVTPRYLQSPACVAEIEAFGARLDAHPDSSELISLMWLDIEGPFRTRGNEAARARINQHQHLDVSTLRNIDPESVEYRNAVEGVAERLAAAIRDHEQIPPRAVERSEPGTNEGDDDLLESMARFEDGQGALEQAMKSFSEAFESVGEIFSEAPALDGASPRQMQAGLATLGHRALAPTDALTNGSRELAAAWIKMEAPARRLMNAYRDGSDAEAREGLRQSLADAAESMNMAEMSEMRSQVRMMGNVSKHLRPLSRALEGALDTVASIRDGLITLRDRLAL
jgi:predicted AAA+ superfamily ATPase